MKHIKRINEFIDNSGGNTKLSKNGKPIIAYHGTDSAFKKFDISYMGRHDEGFYGRGFYFSLDKAEASDYGSTIMEVNIDVKNPFYLRTWSTLGSYVELDLRDDLSKLKGVPSDIKTDRTVPTGYFVKTWETVEPNNDTVVRIAVYPKKELYGTDYEEYGEEIVVTKQEASRLGAKEGYTDQAIVSFTDHRDNKDWDSGLANWLLQKIDRDRFNEILQDNGYDAIFVVDYRGDKTPIDQVSEIIVWNSDQIKIL